MKNKKKAKDLVLRAMQSADSAVRDLQDNQTITGYYGFTNYDISNYVSFIESELNIEITEEDVKNKMSTTVGESINFLMELTLEKESN